MLFRIGRDGPEAVGFAFGEDQIVHRRFERNAHARPAGVAVERAGGGQNRIAKCFGIDPLPVHFPQQPVVRIGCHCGVSRRRAARLFVRLRRHHQAHHSLHAPRRGLFDHLACQPVEQFRVRGLIAAGAEIVDAANEAATEQMVPKSVDDHPRCQRMVRRRQPVRELNAVLRRACLIQ